MTAKRFCIAGLVFYAVLSSADFALTYLIIRNGLGYESNPVAEAWLHRHGWEGLAVFKALSAGVFGATVAVIARHRPRTAAALVAVGCVALLLVVRHSRAMLDEGERKVQQQPEGEGASYDPVRPHTGAPLEGRQLRRRLPLPPDEHDRGRPGRLPAGDGAPAREL